MCWRSRPQGGGPDDGLGASPSGDAERAQSPVRRRAMERTGSGIRDRIYSARAGGVGATWPIVLQLPSQRVVASTSAGRRASGDLRPHPNLGTTGNAAVRVSAPGVQRNTGATCSPAAEAANSQPVQTRRLSITTAQFQSTRSPPPATFVLSSLKYVSIFRLAVGGLLARE